MKKSRYFKTAGALVLTVLLSLQTVKAADDNCMRIFKNMQQRVSSSDLSFTATAGDIRAIYPYSYQHAVRNGHEYVQWRTLNGEAQGYALRDLEGFDFNEDRDLKAPLSFHITQIFDRLVSKHTSLEGYQCIFSGRTRLNGRKVSLLRMLPNDQRYGFALAIDDDSYLPVELNLVSPQGNGVTKISATDIKKGIAFQIPSDEDFDKFALLKTARTDKLDPWGFLKIPAYFKMTAQGAMQMPEGDVCPYQQFSDGLFTFSVYINSLSSVTMPEISAGAVSVYRMHDSNREYAVVGEIPMELAKSILSEVGHK